MRASLRRAQRYPARRQATCQPSAGPQVPGQVLAARRRAKPPGAFGLGRVAPTTLYGCNPVAARSARNRVPTTTWLGCTYASPGETPPSRGEERPPLGAWLAAVLPGGEADCTVGWVFAVNDARPLATSPVDPVSDAADRPRCERRTARCLRTGRCVASPTRPIHPRPERRARRRRCSGGRATVERTRPLGPPAGPARSAASLRSCQR